MTIAKHTRHVLLRAFIAGIAAAIVVCVLGVCAIIGLALLRHQITLHPATLWERDGLAISEANALLYGAVAGALCGVLEFFLVYRRLRKRQQQQSLMAGAL